MRGAALTPRHFWRRRHERMGVGGKACQECTVGRKAYSCSVRAVREAYMNLLFPRLCHFFQFSLCSQQQQAEDFLHTSNHFHALEIAAFAFKPYTYVPTPPRSKSTATCGKPTPEQVSILNKLQHIRSSGASLSTPRPTVASATNNDGGYKPGIRSM